MTNLLSVSKAARLAGVSRSKIQKTIRSGQLETFEGKVQIEDLLRVFPRIDLDSDPVLEQIEQIKAKASSKFSWQNPAPPSAEILLRRLQAMSSLLIQTKSALHNNIDLIASVSTRLDELGSDQHVDEFARKKLHDLQGWLACKQSELGAGHDAIAEAQDDSDSTAARLRHDKAVMFARNMLLHIIAPSVQMIPSGHEFLVEGGDTILDGAIRAGLNVNYGCNNRKCGNCKARKISGEVLEINKPGYKLSAQEKQLGYMLMCCNTAVTDLTLEAGEAVQPEDLPEQQIEASVSSLQALNEQITLLHLRTDSADNFRFFAGQTARLSLPDGPSHACPIFSCPCDGQNLYFIIHQLPGDKSATDFANALHVKDNVTIEGPHGDFFLQENSSHPSLFIAGDHGFAQIKSLIEHAISIDKIKAFRLYRAGSQDSPSYYDNLCRSWRDAFENFSYANLSPQGNTMDIITQIKSDDLDLSTFDAYIAGPRDFTEMISSELIGCGMKKDRLRAQITSRLGI